MFGLTKKDYILMLFMSAFIIGIVIISLRLIDDDVKECYDLLAQQQNPCMACEMHGYICTNPYRINMPEDLNISNINYNHSYKAP